MVEQFKCYFVKLERLSSAELDCSAEKLVLAENKNIAKLIAHIAEMSARKVALELGYKNLFDYCVSCRYRHDTHYAEYRIMPR